MKDVTYYGVWFVFLVPFFICILITDLPYFIYIQFCNILLIKLFRYMDSGPAFNCSAIISMCRGNSKKQLKMFSLLTLLKSIVSDVLDNISDIGLMVDHVRSSWFTYIV